jgi:Xaa-Pro dipeptidase
MNDQPQLPADGNATASQWPAPLASRRDVVDARHQRIASLLDQAELEGLLVLDPINFAWLTAGGQAQGTLSPEHWPGLYFSGSGRWLISCNLDTQRFFDEEIDQLGFQLKEWSWDRGRDLLLMDICYHRRVGCDLPYRDCQALGPTLATERRRLTDHEKTQLARLGAVLVHALEATARTLALGESEEEIAGQLSHRLLHRGAEPVLLQVAADGRASRYPRLGHGTATVQQSCLLTATARQNGLHASASRLVCFGPPEAALREGHEAAARITASSVALSRANVRIADVLAAQQVAWKQAGHEHDWRLSPPSFLTGYAPVELLLTPGCAESLALDRAIVWTASVHGAVSCDTYLLEADGPIPITRVESWPVRRIKIGELVVERPDILVRKKG